MFLEWIACFAGTLCCWSRVRVISCAFYVAEGDGLTKMKLIRILGEQFINTGLQTIHENANVIPMGGCRVSHAFNGVAKFFESVSRFCKRKSVRARVIGEVISVIA